jgi:hypothetical protein
MEHLDNRARTSAGEDELLVVTGQPGAGKTRSVEVSHSQAAAGEADEEVG